MLVIDASALIEVLTVDPAARPDLVGRVRGVDWMSAPALVDYEVLNALRKMLLRGDVDEAVAEDSRRPLRELRLQRHSLNDELTDRIWQLRSNATAYDAAYVALAEHLDVPLVTTERRLHEGLKGLTHIRIESYTSTS